jgi:hypothetical protein
VLAVYPGQRIKKALKVKPEKSTIHWSIFPERWGHESILALLGLQLSWEDEI